MPDFTSRVISAILGGVEWLESAASRQVTLSQRDLQHLLQAKVRLVILAQRFANNQASISDQEHNRALFPQHKP